MNDASPLTSPRGLLLDMDGTLTEPMLDFPRIKTEMGIGTQPILEALAMMRLADRIVAQAVLDRHETIAARESTLSRGCRQLLSGLTARGIGVALVTRNSRVSVQTLLARHELPITICITRDDGPFKPDPWPLLEACSRLGLGPADVWMVGDGHHDIQAGLSAGVRTVWISQGQSRHFDATPWREARDLVEMATWLGL